MLAEVYSMKKRVVITGLGTVNPLGNSIDATWAAVRAGKCGIGPVTKFDTTDIDSKIAGEVRDFRSEDWIDPKSARKMALFSQYAVAASVQAARDSGLEGCIDGPRTGVVIGTGIGGFEVLNESHRRFVERGPRHVLPLTIPEIINNEAAANVSKELGIKGLALTTMTACSSGTDAIGSALDLIRAGRCDVCFAGGTESAITDFAFIGFTIIKALCCKFNDDPQHSSRPFDKDRAGFVMSEGAAVLVLEELEHALARGAKIYAEVAGYGLSCDAYHITAPAPDGIEGARAITRALEDAGIRPEEVQYYNAHGTSTAINDPLETKMIKMAFGDHAREMKISSTKSMTGHLIAASGALEAIFCTLAIRDGFYPPTINLENPDLEAGCDLDYVPNKGVEGEIEVALSGSLGFGGHNGVVAIRKYHG